MQAQLAWEMEGRLIVAVHTRRNPSESEWSRFINTYLSRPRPPDTRVLVVSYGGAPDAAQRKQLADALKVPAPTAIMTASVVLRSLGTAFAFFNRQMKIVGIDEHDAACRYLGLSQEEAMRVRKLRSSLEQRLELANQELRA